MATELPIGILASECPLDGTVLGIAASLPCADLFGDEFLIADPPVQALASEGGDLDFGHVQPTSVLGRVVEDDPTQQLAGCPYAQDLGETCPEVRVEVIEHQMDAS